MKRSTLLKHLKKHGCKLLREGSRDSIYIITASGKTVPVPRHIEIADLLAREICRDLGILAPK